MKRKTTTQSVGSNHLEYWFFVLLFFLRSVRFGSAFSGRHIVNKVVPPKNIWTTTKNICERSKVRRRRSRRKQQHRTRSEHINNIAYELQMCFGFAFVALSCWCWLVCVCMCAFMFAKVNPHRHTHMHPNTAHRWDACTTHVHVQVCVRVWIYIRTLRVCLLFNEEKTEKTMVLCTCVLQGASNALCAHDVQCFPIVAFTPKKTPKNVEKIFLILFVARRLCCQMNRPFTFHSPLSTRSPTDHRFGHQTNFKRN